MTIPAGMLENQETQTQETPPTQTQESQTQETSQQPTQTSLPGQPTSPQATRQIDPLVQAAMRDLYLENQKLQQQVAQAQASQKSEKATFDSFMADPEELINRAVSKQIAPIMQQLQQYGRVSAYDSLKNKFKNSPEYAQAVQQYESVIDAYMQNAELTEQNFYGAIVAAIGQSALQGRPFVPNAQPQGGIPNVSGQPYVPGNVGSQQPVNQNIPAQARPSAPPTPNPTKEPELRQPTESERRIMRTFGYDPANKDHLKEFYAEMTKDVMELNDHPNVKKA